jgi:C-5 cytosine-specific DNA methylase
MPVAHRPRLLDLFCGAGGAAVGYQRAGFDVYGVDIVEQPHYPFAFLRENALDVLRVLAEEGIAGFDAVHASPPCQGYAAVTRWRGDQGDHPRLLEVVRSRLRASGLPWVMENVRTPALRPCLVLCGSMFDLPIRRHRGFETSWNGYRLVPPCRHRATDLPFMHKHERAYADAMGCEWMTVREAREAIPPAYTEHVGGYLLAELGARVS